MTDPQLQLELDTDRVVRDGQVIELTRMEARLLAYLWARPGQPVSEGELLTEVWGYAKTASRTVKTTVSRLRRKLEPDPSDPRWLRTVSGRGYLLAVRPPVDDLPPLPTTGRFIDRPELVARARQALEEAGAVALVGPGGAGKTRLAVALGRASAVPAGFVSLAAAHTVTDAALAVASALGLAVSGDPVEAVGARLADLGPSLLILDNLEQVPVEVGAALERWRTTAPALCLVWTTRVAFPVEGAVQVMVGPMTGEQAVALFQLRAAAQADPIDVTPEAARRVTDRLAGLPLAVELAASWLDVLTPDDIHARLDRDGSVALDGLGAAMDGSWELLSPSDRDLLAQLGAFPASFRAGQAEAVAVARQGSVLGGMRSLRQASLLGRGADGRFAVLVPIREQLADRLPDVHGRAVRRLVDWGATAAAEQGEALHTGGFDRAWQWFRTERELLRGVHDLALALPDPEAAATVVLALARVADILGSTEAAGRLDRTLALEGLTPRARAALASARARTLGHAGSYEAASAAAAQAERSTRPWPDLHLEACHNQAALALISGTLDPGALPEPSPATSAWLRSRVAGLRAQTLRHQGRSEHAGVAYREALEHARASGSPPFLVRALAALGEHLAESGAIDEGGTCLDEAVALAETRGLGTATARSLMMRSNAASSAGRVEEARRDMVRAVGIQRRTGGIRPLVNLLLRLGHLEANTGALERARAANEEGLALAEHAGATQMAFLFRVNLSVVAIDEADPDRALALLDGFDEAALEWELNLACVLFHRAWALAALGDRAGALAANARSRAIYAASTPLGAAECDALQACLDPTDRDALDRARQHIAGMERGTLGAIRVLQQRVGEPALPVPAHVRKEAGATALGRQVLRWLDAGISPGAPSG